MNVLKYKGREYYNFPKKLSVKDYKEVLEETRLKIREFNDLIVYKESKKLVSVPGISDMDFIIVHENPSENIKNAFRLELQNERTKYIFMHEDIFLTKHLFKEYSALMLSKNKTLDLIHGKKLKLNHAKVTQFNFREIDDFVMHLIKSLLKQVLSKKRNVLRTIHLLNHTNWKTIPLFTKFLGKKDLVAFNKFLRDIKNMRKNWFKHTELENVKKLDDLLMRSEKIFELLIISLTKFIKANFIKNKTDENKTYYLSDSEFPIIFKNSNNYINETKKLYDKYKKIISVFPPEFFFLISEYSKQDCFLAKELKKRVNAQPDMIKEKYKKQAKRRIVFYNEFLLNSKKHKLELGPLINLDIHTAPPKNILKKAKRKIRKIKNNFEIARIMEKESRIKI